MQSRKNIQELRRSYKIALWSVAGLVIMAEVITQLAINNLEGALLEKGIEPVEQLFYLRLATYSVGIMIILVLPYLAFTFFRPVVRTIDYQLNELEASQEKLKENEKELKSILSQQAKINEELLHTYQELEQKNQQLKDSERKLLEIMDEQLAVSENLYRTQRQLKEAFKIGRFAAWSFEAKGEEAYVTLNDEYFELLGTNIQQEGSYKFHFLQWMNRFVFPEDHAHVLAKLSEALQKENFDESVDFRIRRADNGQLRYMRTTAYAKLNAKTGIISGGGTIQDITEQKQYEEQLRNSEMQLRELLSTTLEQSEQLIIAQEQMQRALDQERESKHKLEEALRQLQEAQTKLIQSEKMASLGVLTAGIAHEINNPINFVYNGIDTLRMLMNDLLDVLHAYEELHSLKQDYQKLSIQLQHIEELKADVGFDELISDLQALIGDIAKGAARTMEIVKGLRTFSRLDEEERKLADLHEGIDSTLILLHSKYKNRIQIKKFYDPDLKPFYHYPGQLNQVFMNLLTNAIQAIPEDRKDGVIEIFTEDMQETVVVRIRDNGVGIPEDKLPRIFEPFFTTKPVGVGTGLGLAIVHSIIDKHGGSIEVHSQLGKGTEFVITIPKRNE